MSIHTRPAGKPKVAVIGGGWAGLAAAEALAGQADVTLFEAGKTLGGRARAVAADSNNFAFLDNGQHLLVGAYQQCLALLARAGVAEADAFLRLPLTWHMADGVQFQAARLPSPWHLLLGVLGAKGAAWGEKTALLQQMRALQQWHRRQQQNGADIDVAQWLRQHGVSQKWQQQFWQPLVWGSLNTDLGQASTLRLANVLADGVWRERAHSDMLIATGDLQQSWVAPVAEWVEKQGVAVHTGTRIGTLRLAGETDQIWVDEHLFSRVVVAVAPYHVEALLPPQTPPEFQAALNTLHYRAITTVYLRYPQAVPLKHAITGLAKGTAQWLIARGALGGNAQEVAAVVSLSDQYGTLSNEEWTQRVHQDLLRLYPDLPPPIAGRAITEKRATIESRPDMAPVPQAWLRGQGVYLAGDYIHPRYPATLEAAVQSGQAAAAALLADWQQRPVAEIKRL